MFKKTLLIGSSLFAFLSAAHSETNSLIVLDTKKNIEETKYESPAKIKPQYNITNILNKDPQNDSSSDINIYFSADNLTNNSANNTVEASGNVEIIRENLTLRADKIT